MRTPGALILVAAMVAGCDAYDTDLGPTPYLCGPTEPRCPTGYACVDDPTNGKQVCVPDGETLDAEFDCADDSAYEPNDALEEAMAAPGGVEPALAICPARDRDLFAVSVTSQSSSIELLVTFGEDGAPLSAAILNAGGIPIAPANATPDAPRTLRAFAQNLPTGTYYAQVTGPTSTATIAVNNYSLQVSVAAP